MFVGCIHAVFVLSPYDELVESVYMLHTNFEAKSSRYAGKGYLLHKLCADILLQQLLPNICVSSFHTM